MTTEISQESASVKNKIIIHFVALDFKGRLPKVKIKRNFERYDEKIEIARRLLNKFGVILFISCIWTFAMIEPCISNKETKDVTIKRPFSPRRI